MFVHLSVSHSAPRQTTPLGRHPLGRHPLDRHPLDRHFPRQTPPVHTPLWDGHWSGRYTSYWNAFLFLHGYSTCTKYFNITCIDNFLSICFTWVWFFDIFYQKYRFKVVKIRSLDNDTVKCCSSWLEFRMKCLPHSVISMAPVFSVVLPVPQETQFPEPAPVLYFPISQGSQDAPPWPALQTE